MSGLGSALLKPGCEETLSQEALRLKRSAGFHIIEAGLHIIGAGLRIIKARLRGTAQAGQDSIHLEIRKLIAEKARPVFPEPAVSYLDS